MNRTRFLTAPVLRSSILAATLLAALLIAISPDPGVTPAGRTVGKPSTKEGLILARVVGPNAPDVPGAKNTIAHFWVTLEVVGAFDDFGRELTGKTIQLQTEAFEMSWLGRTMPLCLWNPGSEYMLPCTSLGLSHMIALNVRNYPGLLASKAQRE
jgi:hypothetical protein